MKSHFRRTIGILVALFVCCPESSPAKTVVFPFQVHRLVKKNHQWLGRAISFYVSTGLELNGMTSVKDWKVAAILSDHNISFPYVITKATCIKLATLLEADHIIWGEVDPTESPQTHNVQIKSTIIDVNNLSQKYLPLLKFHLLDFYVVQRELLKMALDHFQKTSQRFPLLNLDYNHYELFVKSLLLEDHEKKRALLEQASRDIQDSDYLNFELAKTHLCLGKIPAAAEYLGKIPAGRPFAQERDFMQGLVLYHQNRFPRSLKLFSKLHRLKVFFADAANNLGILFLKDNPPQMSKSYFFQSLRSRKDPDVYINYIKLLLDSGNHRLAAENLKQALNHFPDEEDLIRLLGYFLSREKNQDQLFSVFKKFIPQLTPATTPPDLDYKIKNPFDCQTHHYLGKRASFDPIKSGEIPNQDTDQALKRVQESMEVNPFDPRLHQILSRLYLKKNNRRLSKRYDLSAEFLMRGVQSP